MGEAGRRDRRCCLRLLLGGGAWLAAGCGYSLAGRGSFLPAYVQSIGVPLFVNNTAVFDLEQLLTQRVRQEFLGRGRYQVRPDATGVDALLTGTIAAISIVPAAFTDQQQASRYIFVLTMQIQFRDLRADRILWENPALVFREEYEVTTGSGALDANAFFGQESNAVERIAEDFAKTVVSAILEAF
jgi:hypothetical protein